MPASSPPYPKISNSPVPPATSGPPSPATSSSVPIEHEREADERQQRAVDERAQDALVVLVDDAADPQLAATGQRQDPVDPVREPAEVREHREQLVADHLVAIEHRRRWTSGVHERRRGRDQVQLRAR